MTTQQQEEQEWCGCESDDEYSVSKSGCDNLACGEEEEQLEWTEFEVEYGYMIDEETHGESCSEGYDNKEEAKEYYDMLVSNNEYDYVWLVERTMEGEDCMDSDFLMEWKK